MKTVKKLFRNSYSGEDVYSMATYANGTWEYSKEYIGRTLETQGFGKTAVIIGNGTSRLEFNLTEFKKPNVQKRLKTYGCNKLFNEFDPDFLIVTRPKIIEAVVNSKYCDDHVVYAPSAAILDNPGAFHMIPQDPSWNAGSVATYLSCFDGHSVVYLIGFDGVDTPGHYNNVYAELPGYHDTTNYNDNFMSLTMAHVFKTYPLVDFVLVNSTGRGYMPDKWYGFTNLRRISFRQLVLECDL
jgi:hypothetical protein